MSIFRKITGKGDDAKPVNNEAAAKPAAPQQQRPAGQPPRPAAAGGGDRVNVGNAEAGSRLRPTERLPELNVGVEQDMLKILCEQAGLELVRLTDYPKATITKDLLKRIPSELARSWKVFPVKFDKDSGTLTVAIADPLNVRVIDDLRLMMNGAEVREIHPVVAREEEISDYINIYYGVGDQTLDQVVEGLDTDDTEGGITSSAEGTIDLSDLGRIQSQEPIIRFCNLLILQAIKERASDIHIEPFSGVLRIRYRTDGMLREIPSPPKSWQAGVLSRLKVMAVMDIAENRRPQDGRIKLVIDGREVDCRVSSLPVVHGECIAMRLLDKSAMMVGVEQIGMGPDLLKNFMKLVQRPNGILLVTGPTGSGKTTTLYAALNEINDPEDKIITTEDPVEYQLDGIVQVNINTNVGLTFARCLRAILRQDPDVILVGEIRDSETAQIAIQASLTGHLVFSTLHTNSAAATISRLVDMGVEPFLITSTLAGVVAQRLVRMNCPRCRTAYKPTVEELAEFGTTPEEVADITFMKGRGCDNCHGTGYKGRIGIFELLMVTEEIQNFILNQGTTDEIHDMAVSQGMVTMRQDGWMKIILGTTTFEEVAKHTPRENPDQIRKEMKQTVKETVQELNPNFEPVPGKTMAEIQGAPMIDLTSVEDLEGEKP
jgi:type II secretion system protein E